MIDPFAEARLDSLARKTKEKFINRVFFLNKNRLCVFPDNLGVWSNTLGHIKLRVYTQSETGKSETGENF